MNRKKIKLIVEMLLKEHGLTSIPIDVDQVASILGAEIRSDKLQDDLSGFAYQKHGTRLIGVNSEEPYFRQRFTIAHELGHLFLHKQKSVNYDQGIMLMRDSHSREGTDVKEIEANRFAAELLMPEEQIRKDLSSRGRIDLMTDDSREIIGELADRYEVSFQAMAIRLTTLYFS
jgi:Zn-dependent peptidase ImmA (M78 family)